MVDRGFEDVHVRFICSWKTQRNSSVRRGGPLLCPCHEWRAQEHGRCSLGSHAPGSPPPSGRCSRCPWAGSGSGVHREAAGSRMSGNNERGRARVSFFPRRIRRPSQVHATGQKGLIRPHLFSKDAWQCSLPGCPCAPVRPAGCARLRGQVIGSPTEVSLLYSWGDKGEQATSSASGNRVDGKVGFSKQTCFESVPT